MPQWVSQSKTSCPKRHKEASQCTTEPTQCSQTVFGKIRTACLQKLTPTWFSSLYWLFCPLSSLFCFVTSGWPATAWRTQKDTYTTKEPQGKWALGTMGSEALPSPAAYYIYISERDQNLRKTSVKLQMPAKRLHSTDRAFKQPAKKRQ